MCMPWWKMENKFIPLGIHLIICAMYYYGYAGLINSPRGNSVLKTILIIIGGIVALANLIILIGFMSGALEMMIKK